jgi:glycosyltransferase involved in cell wall biosynthesis
MKILHIISSANPLGGGPIEGIKQLASVNASHGHRIEVATLDDPDAAYVKSFPFPIYALGPGYFKYRFSPRLAPWLNAHIAEYDVVIINGLWQYHSFAAWRALRHKSTPYVIFTHGMLDPWFKRTYPLKHLKKLLYWPWGEYRVLRDANAALFTCEEERMLARQSFRLYHCKEIVVNYGTAGPRGRCVDTFYRQFPDLARKRLAIFVSRLHVKKGCDLLIRAFAKVLATANDWHLLICGPDQVGLQAELQALASDLGISSRITWTGMVSGDLKWGALQASEIFVLPSHQENFGIVVAEALACALPVLISNKVNIWREVLEDGAGLVADDTFEGTCAMLEKWSDLSLGAREAVRVNTRPCFERRFEIQSAARNLITVLDKVCAAPRA